MARVSFTSSVSTCSSSQRSSNCARRARPVPHGVTQTFLQGPLRSLLYIHPSALVTRRQRSTRIRGTGDKTGNGAGGRFSSDATGSTNARPQTEATKVTSTASAADEGGDGSKLDASFSLAETPAPKRVAVSLGSLRQRDELNESMSAPPIPSRELVELVKVQLDMLVSMLESRISEEFNTVPGSDCALGVRCAMYCRTASTTAVPDTSNDLASSYSSFQGDRSSESNNLRLQLVAASGGFGDEGVAFDDDDVFSSSPSSSVITASSEMEESWLANQAMVVLPDNGGLMLPLTHQSFLVGLLLVERVAKEVGMGDGVGASMEEQSDVRTRSNSSVWIPPVQDVFGPAEMGIIRQSAQALSMSCAMELRALVDAAQNKMQQERLQGLLSQASKPLTTLKTLGRMLQPRLAPGEPERDMTDGVVAQGQYLGDLLEQIQKAVGGDSTNRASGAIGLGRAGDTRNDRRMPQLPPGVVSKDDSSAKRASRNARGLKTPFKYALPSSSIGSDNAIMTWDVVSTDEDEQDNPEGLQSETQTGPSSSAETEQVVSMEPLSGGSSLATSTDVSDILRPLLDSATAFCDMKGVSLVVEGDVMNETAPCMIQGEYSLVKHVLGTLLEEGVDLAVAAEPDSRVNVRVAKEKGRGFQGITVEVSVPLIAADEEETLYMDMTPNLAVDLEAFIDDVDGLNGQVQLRDESIAVFLPFPK